MPEVTVAPAPKDPPLPPTEVAAEEDTKPTAVETPLSPCSVEHRYEKNPNTNDEDDEDMGNGDPEENEEGAKEEEDLFVSLEKEQEGQEKTAEQPCEVTAAPRLLQKALTAGEVQDDSSIEEKKDSTEATANVVNTEEVGKPHVHHRVRCPPVLAIPFAESFWAVGLDYQLGGLALSVLCYHRSHQYIFCFCHRLPFGLG
jgi:hypothetical protein